MFLQLISEALPDADPDLRLAHVSALSVFARLAPDEFEQKSDVIMSFLVKKILMVPNSVRVYSLFSNLVSSHGSRM